ncbi:MAG: glycosyltransferase family 4 protein [Lachnospiraceae bacterium]|nr:glycosyltransferase family 4 protein [Lachnospiraceae bacterium]
MKQRLKILFLLEFFSFYGGTEYINYNLISGLKELGHDVRVCVGERLSHDEWEKMLHEKGVDLLVSDIPYDISYSLGGYLEFIRYVVDRLVAKWKPDLIFSHPPGKMLISYLGIHLQSTIPVAAMEYTVPGESTDHWYHPELKTILPRISAFIAKCGEAEKGLRDYFGYKGKIYRLPNLVAKVPAPETDIKGDLLSVGCVGRLSPEKGIGFLLGAWRQVVKEVPEASLHIYGHGQYGEYYRQLANSLGLQSRVIFEGAFHPITGLDKVADRHRIFVQPSLFESMPNSLIELMLRGKAIVATGVGGIPELIRPEHGEGILVEPGSSDSLAAAILSLMRDEGLADTMARKSREQVQKNYDYDSNLLKYEQVLLEIAGKGAMRE